MKALGCPGWDAFTIKGFRSWKRFMMEKIVPF
jgi:hypothetical protein